MKFGLTDEVIQAIEGIFASHPEVEKAILYGSRAKGTFKDSSDIDVTLVGNTMDINCQMQIAYELDELLLPYKFDLSLYHHILQQDLKDHIQRVGQLLYHKGSDG